MEQKISIKEPCHMRWKDMDKIQDSKNRHCNNCSIDIIDFTQMSNDEIIEYLSARKNEKVCAKMYSVDALSNLSKYQNKVLGWYKKIDSSIKNRYFKSVMLAFVGLMTFTTGCTVGDPGPPVTCRDEYVPDTTTTDPNDSIYVEVCN